MKRALPVLLIIVLMMPLTSSAFDGKRKGFIIGGGLGLSPVARWSAGDYHERAAAFGLHLIAGYAWNNDNIVVYEVNSSFFASRQFNSDWLWGSDDMLTSQVFEGASWYHYFGPAGNSLFTVAGLGLFVFDRGRYYHSDPGGGYMIGGGYEFFRHFQIGLYLSGGRTFDAGQSFGHNNLNLLASAVAF